MTQSNRLTLLIVTDTFFPHWTGISKSMFNFAKVLQSDFATTVLTVAHTKNLKKHETISNINIIREPYQLIISRSHYSFSIIFRLLQIGNSFDVIFLNSPSANILPFAAIAKILGKKLYVFHQGDLILPKGFKNKVIEKVFDFCTLCAFTLADKVSTYTKEYAASSRVMKPFLEKLTPLLLPVIVNTKPQREPLIQKKNNQIFFGFGGRFVQEKGFDILFKAIPLIKKKHPGAKFLFAGQLKMEYEDFFSTIKKEYDSVKEDIIILGLLDDSALAAFYHTVDFMIFPSRSDCFNLMQAEAMLCKTPCITSNTPGLSYMVKKTGFGVLFEQNNPSDLAEKTNLAVAKRKEIMLEYNNVLIVLEGKTNAEKIRNFIRE